MTKKAVKTIIYAMIIFEASNVFGQSSSSTFKPSSYFIGISAGKNFRPDGSQLNRGAPWDVNHAANAGEIGVSFLRDKLSFSVQMMGKMPFIVPIESGPMMYQEFSVLRFYVAGSIPKTASKYFYGPIGGVTIGSASSNYYTSRCMTSVFLQANANFFEGRQGVRVSVRPSFNFLNLGGGRYFGSMIELVAGYRF